MTTLAAISLFGALLAADPEGQPSVEPDDARKLVERSLAFLETGAVAWVAMNKCVTCHHVPTMLWTHHEARKLGFAVNEKAVRDLETEAISQYLGHPEFTPTGQDKGFLEKPLGPGSVYLVLGLQANPAPSEEAVQALEKLRSNFVTHQNENGSWTTKVNQAPLIDSHDVVTMQILLAMGDGGPAGKHRDAWDRGWKWLQETPLRDETQPIAYRLLIASRCRNQGGVQKGVEQLRTRQQADGGWSQKPQLATDALATGQALFALGAAGVGARHRGQAAADGDRGGDQPAD
jgi:squalene-hopene/tetraprenyl-beta-curcumene cyclase